MLIVHVDVEVKPECIDDFKAASSENARNSVKEDGIVRFDVIQNEVEPTRFVLVEVYRTADDPGRHEETEHYQAWRETVGPMMARDRVSAKYHEVYFAG